MLQCPQVGMKGRFCNMLQPAYRILLIYDIHPDRYERYYRYLLGEFVPTMRQMGLHMLSAWHVHGESHHERQVEFVCDGALTLRHTLSSEQFQQAEERLKSYTTFYRRKIVRFEDRFQM
jgi:hypothetical protein